jgi:hypothetical protein
LEASVSEIHRHPLRPLGFVEPLFLGRADKKEIAEHLAASSGWLRRAGEVRAGEIEGTGEVCHVLARPDGSAYLVRARRPGCRWGRRRRAGFAKRRVARVVGALAGGSLLVGAGAGHRPALLPGPACGRRRGGRAGFPAVPLQLLGRPPRAETQTGNRVGARHRRLAAGRDLLHVHDNQPRQDRRVPLAAIPRSR